MKVSLTFDDINTAKICTHALDMYSAIHEVQRKIRMRLKHELVSTEEKIFLEQLRDEFYIGGLDTWDKKKAGYGDNPLNRK